MSTREHIRNIVIKYTTGETKIISGVELANKLGVTVSAVNKWKNGESTPSVDLFEEMCRIFKISIHELLGIDNGTFVSQEDKELLDKIKKDPALYEYICKVVK